MALTVSQYNSILRQYEEHQTRNRHLHDQRLHHIYETVPGYQALDEAVASTSVAQGKKMLAGDTNALAQLKDQLKDLAQKRAALLLENGYRQIFSIRSTTVLTVRTRLCTRSEMPLLPSGGDRASL